MPDRMFAVLITVSLIMTLLLWVPALHIIHRRMKQTRVLRSMINPHLRKQPLQQNAKAFARDNR